MYPMARPASSALNAIFNTKVVNRNGIETAAAPPGQGNFLQSVGAERSQIWRRKCAPGWSAQPIRRSDSVRLTTKVTTFVFVSSLRILPPISENRMASLTRSYCKSHGTWSFVASLVSDSMLCSSWMLFIGLLSLSVSEEQEDSSGISDTSQI